MKRKYKPVYNVTGITHTGNQENIAQFDNKAKILKGLRQQGLDFERYQSITITKTTLIIYETKSLSET
ncbi:hypothetical protein [Rodentibacter pneumotropicus]|uniref:hypothetical protein n=1 Tax=Rodentibacter pneumotropicus TaxID=758 RepID=UPI000985331D|nr:hypothetical protein [Rodentibacter pneumotropicus]THA19008.1 hypothetical protein D3M83_02385 [Rodentibacter pneumotropicus]